MIFYCLLDGAHTKASGLFFQISEYVFDIPDYCCYNLLSSYDKILVRSLTADRKVQKEENEMQASYETILVVSTALDEEATKALVTRFTDLISANGSVESVDEWGKRRLAYEINDEKEGNYFLINFTADTDFISELNRIYAITDGLLRTIVVRKDQ